MNNASHFVKLQDLRDTFTQPLLSNGINNAIPS